MILYRKLKGALGKLLNKLNEQIVLFLILSHIYMYMYPNMINVLARRHSVVFVSGYSECLTYNRSSQKGCHTDTRSWGTNMLAARGSLAGQISRDDPQFCNRWSFLLMAIIHMIIRIVLLCKCDYKYYKDNRTKTEITQHPNTNLLNLIFVIFLHRQKISTKM